MKNRVFMPADILIPEGISREKWAVIACDQFSAEPEYWKAVEEVVGDAPSMLNIIVPEAYLGKYDEAAKNKLVGDTMKHYLKSGIFNEIKNSFIYVERLQSDGKTRRGIIGCVDLEEYDFSGKKGAAILASEATVLDRLPPRILVRREASLESPHIMALIDDKNNSVVEPLAKKTDNLPLLYDFPLMLGGGHVKGYRVFGAAAEEVTAALDKLHEVSDPLLVMGDGNHSLAAAKSFWDEIKQNLSENERVNHVARYALLEINNVYDPAIGFEPIHRVLFDVDSADFIKEFEAAMPAGNEYNIEWIAGEKSGNVGISANCIGDMLSVLQNFLDDYAKRHKLEQEYIHGDTALEKLAKRGNNVGLLLPAMDKSEIFKTVTETGVFPRKSFSIGHARDKRYYFECRKIVM